MKSRALGRQVSYSISIPEEWNAGPGPYSVLYQLHGSSDDHVVWLAYSNLVRYASKCQLPIIIVMPDGANSFWLNIDESQRYEDFMIGHNRRFHEHLRDLGIVHTYNEHPGTHNWDYWDLHVKDALEQHARVLGHTAEVKNEAS